MLCGLTAGAAGKSSNGYRDANVLAFCLLQTLVGAAAIPRIHLHTDDQIHLHGEE